jgi:hypothetical protein
MLTGIVSISVIFITHPSVFTTTSRATSFSILYLYFHARAQEYCLPFVSSISDHRIEHRNGL